MKRKSSYQPMQKEQKINWAMRLAVLAVSATLWSCATTEFQVWEGRNSVAQGNGGTRKIVDGMDIWTHGDPPRRFQVLGIIEDTRPGGRIPMAYMNHDIVAKARQQGGDAVILVENQSQLAGYYTFGDANAYGYGNSAWGSGSSTTLPLTRHSATYVAIRYL